MSISTSTSDVNEPLNPLEDWIDDDELENDPEFQAWLAIADTAEEEDSTGQASSRRQPGLERDLAQTLNNLGNAYLTQAELGKEPVANLERAIAAFTEVTTISRQPGLERDLATTSVWVPWDAAAQHRRR